MTTHSQSMTRALLDRLARCSEHEADTSTWWSDLARCLDELGEELTLEDIDGLVAQVTGDTPELASRATKLVHLDAHVRGEVSALRLRVAREAGSREAVIDIRDAVRATLRRVRTLDRVSDDLLFEAYERDFGGEW